MHYSVFRQQWGLVSTCDVIMLAWSLPWICVNVSFHNNCTILRIIQCITLTLFSNENDEQIKQLANKIAFIFFCLLHILLVPTILIPNNLGLAKRLQIFHRSFTPVFAISSIARSVISSRLRFVSSSVAPFRSLHPCQRNQNNGLLMIICLQATHLRGSSAINYFCRRIEIGKGW